MEKKLEEAYENLVGSKGTPKHKKAAKPERLVRIDRKDRLYVVRESGGYSARGFEYAAKEARAASEISEKDYDFKEIERGTVAGFVEYETAMSEAREAHQRTGRRARGLLESQLIGLEGKRVEVIDQWDKKHRFIVGKSTGWMPIHLQISRRGAHGGMGTMGPYKSVRVIPGGR